MTGKLFVISAPSGAGKTTLVKAVLEDLQDKYPIKRLITYTTRSIRQGEVDGQHYHFLSTDEFKAKIKEGFFLEWSTWYDHYYGSPTSIIEEVKNGSSYIAILDRAGAADILEAYSDAILVWINPPSLSLLKGRLKKRGKDTPEVIEKRLIKAKLEVEQEAKEQLYQYHLINSDFEEAKNRLISIITTNLGI
jgi:guanylate kinase